MRQFPMIGAFGVELEGGWNSPYPNSYLWDGNMRGAEPPWPSCADEDDERCGECDECADWEDWNNGGDECEGRYRHGDGSVTTRGEWNGEIATPPYTSLTKFKEDFNKVYPNVVNSSCGMHLHISVNAAMGDAVSLYSSMMTPRFKEFILAGIKRWGKKAGVRPGSAFWRRLEGTNSYCLDAWNPDAQARARHRDGVRYAMFNFCFSCEGRGTLEYRFLPMFENKAFGEAAIIQLLRLTNAYLKVAAKQTLKFEDDAEEIEVPSMDNVEVEETHWVAD